MIKLDEKPMDVDQVTSISKADTIEAIGDFWDTHDFTDYDSDSPDVEFRVPARSPMNLRAEALDWLGQAVGAAGSSLAIMPMGGSTSSSLFRVEVPRGDPRRAVRAARARQPGMARDRA